MIMYIMFTEDVMLLILIASAGIGLCDSTTQQLLQRRTKYLHECSSAISIPLHHFPAFPGWTSNSASSTSGGSIVGF